VKTTNSPDRTRTIESLEEAVDELLYVAESMKTPAPTEWERRQRRKQLLKVARRYGRAIEALARGPR